MWLNPQPGQKILGTLNSTNCCQRLYLRVKKILMDFFGNNLIENILRKMKYVFTPITFDLYKILKMSFKE